MKHSVELLSELERSLVSDEGTYIAPGHLCFSASP